MDWLVDPLTAPYMQRALVMLVLLSLPAGALGLLVILRGNVFTAHALGNGAFPGTVAAVALGVNAVAGAFVAALAMGVLIGFLHRRTGVDPAVATALALVGALALGSWLVSQVVEVNQSVDTVLFGSVLGISNADLWRAVVVTIIALVAVAGCWRGWLVSAFDPTNARALGVRPGRLDLLFLIVLALCVVALVAAVGALLVSTFLVVPAATARLFIAKLLPLMLISSALALSLSVVGLLASYWIDAPPGATIAALAAAVFAASFAAIQLRSRRYRRPVVAAAAAAIAILAVTGCGSSNASPKALVDVAATTPQVADWVRHVGGGRVAVTQILRPNVDPHEFEPSRVGCGCNRRGERRLRQRRRARRLGRRSHPELRRLSRPRKGRTARRAVAKRRRGGPPGPALLARPDAGEEIGEDDRGGARKGRPRWRDWVRRAGCRLHSPAR